MLCNGNDTGNLMIINYPKHLFLCFCAHFIQCIHWCRHVCDKPISAYITGQLIYKSSFCNLYIFVINRFDVWSIKCQKMIKKPKMTSSNVLILCKTRRIFSFLSYSRKETWTYSHLRGWNQRICRLFWLKPTSQVIRIVCNRFSIWQLIN